ncbi:MAG: tRNA pseudouridine(13) synthase TruD [Candidatus Krumholzibacteria bacterium]|nr:tRNA pseudouridine(13) synthase TruD [Candidatus Krumholzibacteria bacterium]
MPSGARGPEGRAAMIKRHPEDFFVEEILAPDIASRIQANTGAFAIYRLTKRSLATDEALESIARKLRVPPRQIGYGGLKDKHALTVQYVSIDSSRGDAGTIPLLVETPGWKIELAGRLDRGISAEDVSGNRFRVAVRNLTRRQCERMTATRRALSPGGARGGRTLLFVNYFGAQRFGSARHGRGFAARRLIIGDFEGALRLLIAVPDRKDSRERKAAKRTIGAGWGDWGGLARMLAPCPERTVVRILAETAGDFRAGFSALPHIIKQITIEAYQSYLWNEVARRVIARDCSPPLTKAPSRFGDFAFPNAASVPPALSAAAIALLCPQTALHEPFAEAAASVLASEGISLEDLRVPGLRIPYFRCAARSLFAEAREFSLGPLEADESARGKGVFKRRLRFFLPRGSYATVLLAALGAHAPAVSD